LSIARFFLVAKSSVVPSVESMAIFRKSIVLPVTAAQAFAWHEAPGAFASLTPPWEKVVVIEQEGGIAVGAFVRVKITLLGPIFMKAKYRHTAYDKGQLFVDEQESGPFQSWRHEHRFRDLPNNFCELEDHIEFKAPLMSAWFVVRRLEKMFEYRHAMTLQAMEKISGADSGCLKQTP
jgi:ligand-binding SRPBCC domain-containing protein